MTDLEKIMATAKENLDKDNFSKVENMENIIKSMKHYISNDFDPLDENREESRKYTFFSIFQGVYHIAKASNFDDYQEYFEIPNNDQIFYDVIHRYSDSRNDEGFQYEDKIVDGKFVSKLNKIDENRLNFKIGHSEIVIEG